MPKEHPLEVRDRSVRMVLDRLGNYPPVSAACRDLAPKLTVGAETLPKWVMQAPGRCGGRLRSHDGAAGGDQTPEEGEP